MYSDQINQMSIAKTFTRRTFLDYPSEEESYNLDSLIDEDITVSDTLLTKEEQIDDFEIKCQFVAGTEQENRHQLLTMPIETDISRLCKLYLDSQTKLKQSLPSKNIEIRMYDKQVQQYSLQKQNLQSQDKEASKQNDSQSMRGSVSSSVSLSNRGSSASISSSADFRSNISSTSLDTNRSNSQTNLSTYGSTISTQLNQQYGAKKLNVTTVKQQTTPFIKRVDQIETVEARIWQQFVSELQGNSVVMADIVSYAMLEGWDESWVQNGSVMDCQSGYDFQHSTMLVNLSQYFFDSIHSEERLTFCETSNFLKFFSKFALKYINVNQFEEDTLKNKRIKDKVLKRTLLCLFEGLTRKIPAFNYLRFIYSGPFNRINLYQMESDQERLNNLLNQAKQSEQQKAAPVEEKKKEEKLGFFAKLFKRSEPKKQPQAVQEAKLSLKPVKKVKRYFALQAIYGGELEPFPHIVCDIEEEDNLLSIQRLEKIESKIKANETNDFQLVMDSYPDFQADITDRIIMTESAIRDQSMNQQHMSQFDSRQNRMKDINYYVETMVQKNFEQILNFGEKIPFAIRAMLKIIIIRSRGLTDWSLKIKLNSNEIRLLADILIAGWLNVGYRNPKCFGVQPSIEKALELEFIFFQASRIVFEHIMIMQKLPEGKLVEGFNIPQLNCFIKNMASHVYVFWSRLIKVDITEIHTPRRPLLVETNMLRFDDLELLFIYCQKVWKDTKNKMINKVMDEETTKAYSSLNQLMVQMEAKLEPEYSDCFSEEFPLIPYSKYFGISLSSHFRELCGLPLSESSNPYEYYFLFINSKSEQTIALELNQWQDQCFQEIKTINTQFIADKLAFQIIEQQPRNQSLDSDQRQNSQYVRSRTESQMIVRRAYTNHQSMQVFTDKQIQQSIANQDTRLVQFHQSSQVQLPISQVDQLLINIFNTLRVLLENPQLQLESFRDISSLIETKDLVALLCLAQEVNRIQTKPNTQIQVGCRNIVKMLCKMGLEGQFEIQHLMLSHFVKVIEQKIQTARKYLEKTIIAVDTLANDVEKFEQNITYVKTFYTKYQNKLKFMKTISRYNPEVCLLECFKYELSDEWKQYRGLLLNMSCVEHHSSIQMSSCLLFGVVSKNATAALAKAAIDQNMIMSEDALALQKIRDKRTMRFREIHFQHTKFTIQVQDSTKGQQPKDTRIQSIEELIEYYSNSKISSYLKTLVRADHDKYKAIIGLNIITDIPPNLQSESEKFEYLRRSEPFDYMNMVKTYTLFLQNISVASSTSLKDSYVDEKGDRDFQIKQHYDFLHCDLEAKALRYQVHEFIMKRLHSKIFNTNKITPVDILVQKLILAKSNDPLWVLTSEASKQKVAKGEQVSDFTKTPEWCEVFIYTASLKSLLRVPDEETPHIKAIYIDDSVTQAINAMKIATPYKKSDSWGEPERQRVMKHLILEFCKVYEKENKNPKLYSQLLYVLLFNIPQNELLMYQLIKLQNQRHQSDPIKHPIRDYTKLPVDEQHQLMLGVISTRNKVAEWFQILQQLLDEYQTQLINQSKN